MKNKGSQSGSGVVGKGPSSGKAAMIVGLQQTGERFALAIDMEGPKTTEFYSLMDKLSKLLLSFDKYLLSYIPLRLVLTHLVHEDTDDSQLIINEEVGVAGEVGGHIKCSLRVCKELILSRLETVSTREGFERMVQDLTVLVNFTQEVVSENLSLEGIPCVTLDEDKLVRLLDEAWSFWDGQGRLLNLSILSLASRQRVFFSMKPPLECWIDSADPEKIHNDKFHLVRSDFVDPSKWKARRINSASKRLLDLKIADLKFLEGLQSSPENVTNGLLIGDILKVNFRIEEDPMKRRTTYVVVTVLDHIRGKYERQESLDMQRVT